jgi:thioredoxin type arsenate reductase
VKRRVLFVCTGNRARSQMAEALLREQANDRLKTFSAGVAPQVISPLTIDVMGEIGIDISGQRSKSVDEFVGQEFHYVITVCDSARQTCPAFPGRGKRLHWSIPDPAEAEGRDEAPIDAFRAARDELQRRIEEFVREEGL